MYPEGPPNSNVTPNAAEHKKLGREPTEQLNHACCIHLTGGVAAEEQLQEHSPVPEQGVRNSQSRPDGHKYACLRRLEKRGGGKVAVVQQ